MRILVYTGKGGVGKTSVACATSLCTAERGHRTILLSTDSAHSISDAFGKDVGGEIVNISERLDALEIDVPTEIERHWKDVYEYFVTFLSHYGIERLTAKEISILPGMDLAAALFYIDEFSSGARYDCMVVDTAPTADALRLLSLPDALGWYFEKIFRIQRKAVKAVRATVGRVMRTPLPGDMVFQQAENIYTRLTGAKRVLTDPRSTSVRLVLNPERMVINETRRAFTYLSMYGFTVDTLILNKVMPKDAEGYFSPTLAVQDERLREVEESFAPLPVLQVPRYEREVVGMEMLRRVASDLYGRSDPIRPRSLRRSLRFVSRGRYEIVSLRLPFADEEDIDIYTKSDTLFVRVGGFKRNITLPQSLLGAEVLGGEISGDMLHIRFRGERHDGKGQGGS